MTYFVIYLRTRSEDEYLSRAKQALDNNEAHLIWLRRSLRIKRKGKQIETLAPIFPGYLFVEAQQISPELFMKLSRIPGFLRFLNSNENIVPLSRDDKDLLIYLLSFGQTVRKSVVYFDKNNRIRVVSGPLKQLEGQIIKVDRRKGRAKVRLDMFKNSFLIDFGFEAIEKV
jgi:transcriptional antiterminator NusG